jgi:hypothetical protein
LSLLQITAYFRGNELDKNPKFALGLNNKFVPKFVTPSEPDANNEPDINVFGAHTLTNPPGELRLVLPLTQKPQNSYNSRKKKEQPCTGERKRDVGVVSPFINLTGYMGCVIF